jgi:hypothetical protein
VLSGSIGVIGIGVIGFIGLISIDGDIAPSIPPPCIFPIDIELPIDIGAGDIVGAGLAPAPISMAPILGAMGTKTRFNFSISSRNSLA